MTKKTERIQVRQVEPAFLEGNIDDMISQLQDWKNEGWEGLDSDYVYDVNCYKLYRNRLETDEEYKIRMFQEQRAKERAEAQRRKQYEELKREFGND